MKVWGRRCAGLAMGLTAAWVAAVERFPPPDFESGHQLPLTSTPGARADWWQIVDLGLLAIGLAVATWLVHKRRSRKAVIVLMLGSLLYFGFYRAGCICAIGSIQNVALGLWQPGYVVPWTVLGFFLLPLIVALFWGRSFCAGVCPHGALQDAVLIKPLKVPHWLESGLRLLPWIYLGAAILLAATGSAFVICRYDPFVGIFRLSGGRIMIAVGVALLVLSMFVGRPYCRFLCPLGALLSLCSRFSKWFVRITPSECSKCRLCEDSCPFGAIHQPLPERPAESRRQARRRLGWLVLALPALVVLLGWAGSRIADPLSMYHPRVQLAEQVRMQAEDESLTLTDAVDAFYVQDGQVDRLYQEATAIRDGFEKGGWWLGGFLGLVIGLALVQHAMRHWREDYEADRAHCLACARCFDTCPYERQRRGLPCNPASPETEVTA